MSADAPRATPGNPFANFHLRGGAPPPGVVAPAAKPNAQTEEPAH